MICVTEVPHGDRVAHSKDAISPKVRSGLPPSLCLFRRILVIMTSSESWPRPQPPIRYVW